MQGPTACVLVVDDYADACEAVRRVIARLGYAAACVGSGGEALATLRAGAPPCGLVLLDLMMPEMSGFDVLRAVRADPALRGVPVVVCSAAERATHWDEARELGALDFLVKADAAFFPRLQSILADHLGPPAAA